MQSLFLQSKTKGCKPHVDDSSNLPRPGQVGKPQVESRNPISTPAKKWSNSLLNLLLGLPLCLETWGGAHLGGKPRCPGRLAGFNGSFLPPWCLSGASETVQFRLSNRSFPVLSCLPGASQAVQMVLSCLPGALSSISKASLD